jgi:hypothetical protein
MGGKRSTASKGWLKTSTMEAICANNLLHGVMQRAMMELPLL